MLRSPHIEQTFILEFSDWLQGSRWAKNCEYFIITTAGKVNSFLYYSEIAGIKLSRNTHQVKRFALVILSENTFQNYSDYATHYESTKSWSIFYNSKILVCCDLYGDHSSCIRMQLT